MQDTTTWDGNGRVSWQASPKNKINAMNPEVNVLTYGEFEARANQVAAALQELGRIAGTEADGAIEVTAPTARRHDGVLVHHVHAGPFEGLSKGQLPGQMCVFAREVLRAEARHDQGWYDVIHSHYWVSGIAGLELAELWNVPLIHTMHTMAKVKNLLLQSGEQPEPRRASGGVRSLRRRQGRDHL